MDSPIGLLCTSLAYGGLELNVLHMAEWLESAGYPVVIIGAAHSELARRSRSARLRFFPIRTLSRYFDLISAFCLRKIIRSRNIRTLIVNTTADITRAVLAKIIAPAGVRLVYVQHMQMGAGKRDFYHTWQYRRLDAWITPLPVLAKQVRSLTRVSEHKLHEIPFGIDLDRFIEEKPCRTSARLRLDLPVHGIFAGIVGRIDPQKKQEILIKAAAAIIHSGIPLHILIVGDGTFGEKTGYLENLKALSRLLGIEDFVHFRPFLEEVNQAYAALDVFIMSSQSESYGMVTVEAMAAGLPVIGTRSGGTPELIDDKKTGFLIQPGDASDLESALRLLINFPSLRSSFGKAGRRKAVEKFSHLLQTSRLAAVLEKIA